MLNNWLPEWQQLFKDFELKLCSQSEESFVLCLK